jgi:Ca-activated chloride channel homolog
MLSRRMSIVLLVIILGGVLWARPSQAQVFSSPNGPANRFGSLATLDSIQTTKIDSNVFLINSQGSAGSATPLQAPSGSVSKLDLKSPGKARREYEKGYQLLMKRDLPAAITHLTKSLTLYPSFVAAHNALGTAYLNQGQKTQAREEFARAVALDDHLPNSYLNLGCAQLALDQYADAESSLKKATAIAPLDLQLLTALTYAEFVNRDYPAVIATVQQVHHRKHDGAAVVHYFAAGALEAQDHLVDAQHEMETLLTEEPKSASAEQFRKILAQIKVERQEQLNGAAKASKRPIDRPYAPVAESFNGPTAEDVTRRAQQALQEKREQLQIEEAERAPDPTCLDCGIAPSSDSGSSMDTSVSSAHVGDAAQPNFSGPMLRVAVDEVALFFAATERGKSMTNLAAADVEIRDNGRAPDAIVAFRNEAQLPLRLGLIIDISNSVKDRFAFEQAAAAKFLNTVVTNKNDLAFLVGVNNSVLVVQDFTGDQKQMDRAVGELAPGGGTALWDAVSFAAEKLAKRPETQPVARIVVVISDGEDNSSKMSLKQAIARAQQGEVAVYTVSTRDRSREEVGEVVGDRALKTLSELTGGSAFRPVSVHGLNGSLGELQEVIRGRYLVSYKPSGFQLNGRYRAIEIKAEKDGRKLTVYARKGYYATPVRTESSNP